MSVLMCLNLYCFVHLSCAYSIIITIIKLSITDYFHKRDQNDFFSTFLVTNSRVAVLI